MSDVFISYARSTAKQAQAIAGALRSSGYSVWLDDNLPVHRAYTRVIEEQLAQAKAALVIWSSDAATSDWVMDEADRARQARKLVQATVDRTPLPMPFGQIHCADLSDWSGDLDAPSWRKVVDSISSILRNQSGPTPVAIPAHHGEPLLAVLAFDNLSGDPGLAYFSDGVSDEIQQAVSQGSNLKVIARCSSFKFRGADKAVRKVAAELNATHLLDGSVRRSGDRVRISAQLVECADETVLWTNRLDGDLSDVFALQERIAEAVTRALKATFSSPVPPGLVEPAVYEVFLKARAIISEGGHVYDEGAIDAVPLLEQVVEAAPRHAAAWEILAKSRAYILRSGRRQGGYAEGRAGVVVAAETALRLDPQRGGAYEALAMLEPWGAYGAREILLQKALSVAPNDPSVLTELSTFCWSVGRFREALAMAERACELNPLMPAARLRVAQMLTYVGDYTASIRMHEEIYGRWPRNFSILISLLNFACSLDFWDVYQKYLGETEHFTGWQATYLRETVRYADALASGDPARAKELLDRYAAVVAKSGTVPLNYLDGLAMLGIADAALDLAERASFAHVFDPDGPLPSGSFPGTVLGRWSELNKTPRFIDLCERLGLCVYWVQSDRWPDCTEWVPYDFKAKVRHRGSGASQPADIP